MNAIMPTPAEGEVQVMMASSKRPEEGQPAIRPLPAVMDLTQGYVRTEWEFTAEELAEILDGGRLRLTVLTFNNPLQPVKLEIIKGR